MTLWLAILGCGQPLVPMNATDGQLLYLEELGPPVVGVLDLATAATNDVYEVPSMGFAYELDAGPEVVMAYTPSPVDGEDGFDRSQIAVLVDGQAKHLACEDEADTWCFFPTWSDDHRSVWFVGVGRHFPNAPHTLSRVDVATGAVEAVVPWATEPAVSATNLAWIAVDATTQQRSLVLGSSDGDPVLQLVAPNDHFDIGQPVFSSNGEEVFFVALDGVRHSNHDRPGDWWRVSIHGGLTEKVTNLHTVHYDGTVSPDGQYLAAATREGIVRVDLDTGEVRTDLKTRSVRAIDWL
jgi:hypothetical protein